MRVHGTETLSTCLTFFHIRRPESDISLNFNLCDAVVWNRKESVKSLNFNLSHEKPSTHMCGCYARGIKWKNINFSFEKRIVDVAAIIEASTVEFLSSHLLFALCFLWRRSSARSSERWDCVECRGWNVFRVIRIAQIFLLVFLWHFVVAFFMCDDSEKDENYHREKNQKKKRVDAVSRLVFIVSSCFSLHPIHIRYRTAATTAKKTVTFISYMLAGLKGLILLLFFCH